MFYLDGYLHAIVDEGIASLIDEGDVKLKPSQQKGQHYLYYDKSKPQPQVTDTCTAPTHNEPSNNAPGNDSLVVDTHSIRSNANVPIKKLSNKQQQKAKRKLRKQQAKELKRKREMDDNDLNLINDDNNNNNAVQKQNAVSHSSASPHEHEHVAPPTIRLHQFISTVFRSELNIAENGTGYFIKNAPKASAHYALLEEGVVLLNSQKVCKQGGRTVLKFGDVVSLQLEDEVEREEGELISWKGSKEIALKLQGNTSNSNMNINTNNNGERQGRMRMASTDTTKSVIDLDTCEMVQYYREKLGSSWDPKVHEIAITQPLPLTLRVLKPSMHLAQELKDFGFRPVTEEDDFSLPVSCLDSNDNGTRQLNQSAMQELLDNTWILACAHGEKAEGNNELSGKKLGVFLSEARVTGELMQQELTSMIPVAIMASHLKKQPIAIANQKDIHFLDLCSAPGSKTCQLLTALDGLLSSNNTNGENGGVDFTVVANELSPQRANWMRQRLHQQCCSSKALSNLIITFADGRAYAQMEQHSFDYILCDVPCSGDGNVRKSPKILGKWSPKNGENHKHLQKELLKVGLGLLKPRSEDNGGFLVYSTCSLSPFENEQVISEVMEELNSNPGSQYRFELVDLSNISSSNANKVSNSYLRIHPAKSHGGFFVAGIQKFLSNNDIQKFLSNNDKEPHQASADVCLEDRDIALANVRRNFRDDGHHNVQYSISPSTQRCCAEIVERMGASTVIGSGVAALYQSSAMGLAILQQGCASLSSHTNNNYNVHVTHAELLEGHAKRAAYREVVLPANKFNTINGSVSIGKTIILCVTPSTEDNGSSFLLPARIVQCPVDKEQFGLVAILIIARPQILKRLLNMM